MQILGQINPLSYDRNQLKHGIVHLSVGNFHRSHLAYYMDVLASEHGQNDWGIVGIGVPVVSNSKVEFN